MNDLNPDKKPHILSSPESPEGGTGNSGQANMSEQDKAELSGEVLEGQEGAEAGLETVLEGLADELVAAETSSEDKAPETVIPASENQLDALIEEEVEASRPKFEVGEDGLSLQGSEIQGIQSQIQQLESGQGDLVDSIKSEITQSRQTEIDGLKAENEKLKTEQKQLTDIIKQKYDELLVKAPNTKVTLEEFTQRAMSTEVFSAKVETNQKALEDVEATIEAFDAETQTLIETVIQDKKTELQGQLTEAQASYTESGAEANDKPILLERSKEALEQRLSQTQFTEELRGTRGERGKIEFYISNGDLKEIFELYGYSDGMERIKKLKKDANGSERTEQYIQYVAGSAKERELGLLGDKTNNLQQELDGIEGEQSYQETSHLERHKAHENLKLGLLAENLGQISCEVRLTDKGFELQEDYQRLFKELSSEIDNSVTSINTELDRVRESISNIKALRGLKIPEGKHMELGGLREIEDYLEENKSKSRWNPLRDQDAISRLSPILANIDLRIAERDKYRVEYNSKYNEYFDNTSPLRKLNELYSESEYIQGKLGQTELTDKNSITQSINQLKEYIEQYQKPDDFDTKQERVREVRQEIGIISKQKNDLGQYNSRVIYN